MEKDKDYRKSKFCNFIHVQSLRIYHYKLVNIIEHCNSQIREFRSLGALWVKDPPPEKARKTFVLNLALHLVVLRRKDKWIVYACTVYSVGTVYTLVCRRPQLSYGTVCRKQWHTWPFVQCIRAWRCHWRSGRYAKNSPKVAHKVKATHINISAASQGRFKWTEAAEICHPDCMHQNFNGK